ncbi:nuclease inhibitor [Roseibacterium elongatum DSM 19469]|uniref:Nuclease inhibitor n=1 Tax=Roseicyclus elongatus DSM 19469 TaxID=1294273 RepID=W8S367_9RHOB|nr:DinB family protein [Roseibacterium elongatum]AHM03206.1 nuclease inhibitor [Roseibacterium elongatum DSM 19469]
MSAKSAHPYALMALNNAWANARLYHALTDLPEADFTAPAPGFFPSLCQTLNHIHEVDLYYLDALEAGGMGRGVYDRDPVTNPAALGALQGAADLRLARFCHGLTDATLGEHRVTERRDGPVEERVDALLLHLFQHQIHHRGQAHVQVQSLGVAPPQLDEFHLVHDRHPSAHEYHG